MNISDALDQYRDICGNALNRHAAKLNKSFRTVFIETLLLYMIIPRKINFTQLGRYGKHCEQCFRQNFTKGFDWLSYNLLLCEELFDKHGRKAIAIDPSYISKSGKRTPWIGYFWSGCAGQVKRGLEIMGMGLIDIDKHDCMMLKAVQSPDTVTLSNRGVTLNDWYLKILERDREQLLSVSKYLVADAYFSKYSFTQGLQAMGFHLISRLRDDSYLQYASLTAVNAAKIMLKENSIPFSIETLKNLMYNAYILKRFFTLSGFKPNRKINARLVKELIDIATYRRA